MVNTSTVLESSLKLVPYSSRWFFFWLILIISIVTVIGNVLAIKSIIKRKQKCLQKVCIVSLALADMFSVAMFATNNLDALSRKLKTWILGEFLCHLIPMGQVLGTTASSIALLAIALDRYQNVTIAIVSQRWNPNVWKCIGVASLFLVVCSLMSAPMYVFFTLNPIRIVYTSGPQLVFEDAFLCAAIDKDKLKLYYIIMAVLVFLPIIVIFIWFYYQIAAMIWQHRKPLISANAPKLFIKRTKTVQVQRKIRTFKVIIVLMVAFTACRLPYWLFFVIRLLETISGSTIWYLHFLFISLNMLNCALNPLLYAFLSQTIYFVRKCHNFAHKVVLCCCCFSGKDIDIHQNNPFVVNCENKNDGVDKCKNPSNFRIKFHPPVYDSVLPFKEQLI
ncbi:somatostatin receptor type 5 [Anoplophora glabripennis]|uniref:somatostatin receptor type 5 n=1 Tax=Anoplophora glabripennis TaxID=217634 RepID=UPI000874B3DE|nr:somatostatin receptor type 5 [Anoplophora glabripennis]